MINGKRGTRMETNIMNDIRHFVHERNWEQYHTGENLAKSVAIEAGELLEVFQWDSKEKSVEKVEEEVADVLLYCYMLCDCYGLDPIATMKKKMKRNAEKYPVERSYGSSKRYDE